jgi:hypothetical protein
MAHKFERKSISERLTRLREIEADLGCFDHLDEIKAERLSLEEYYWEWHPHEISWLELKEINVDIYRELKAIKSYLKIA